MLTPCHSVVFTLPYKGPTAESPELLRSYISDNEPKPKPWAIWEAVRATSAATTIFEPFVHGQPGSEIRYIDAGLGFNNPADLVLEEAAALWGDSGYLDTRHDVGCFLTIGTGIGEVSRMDNDTIAKAITSRIRKPLQAVKIIKQIATGTEPKHRSVARRFDPASAVYQRFNVDQGMQAVTLFDHERREDIAVDTNVYLGKYTVDVQMAVAVEKMKTLGLRTPELLEDRDEGHEIFPLGTNKDEETEKLKARLEALKM